MRKRTGYLGIVASLTCAQALYDVSFEMFGLYRFPGGNFAQRFFSYFGGLSSTFWTNVLSYLLLIIIRYGRQFNVKKSYHYLAACVFVPSFSVAVAALATDVDGDLCTYDFIFWISFALRIFSITFNIVCYALISLKLRAAYSNRGAGSSGSTMVAAVRVLASRLKWYAVIQVVTRSTEIGYEIAFGRHGYNTPSDAWSLARWFAFLFEAALAPAAGVGYLVCFLTMQPAAWDTLRTLFCRCCKGGRTREEGFSGESVMGSAATTAGGSGGSGLYKKTSVVVRVGGAVVEYDARAASVDAPPDSFSVKFAAENSTGSASSSAYGSGSTSLSSRPASASVSTLSMFTTSTSDQRLRLLEEEAVEARLRALDDDELVETIVGGGDPPRDEIPESDNRLSQNIL